jgi:hypothetical protein
MPSGEESTRLAARPVELWVTGLVLVALVVAAAGAAADAFGDSLPQFDLGSELDEGFNFPVIVSAAVLVGAAVAAAILFRRGFGGIRLVWLGLGAVFAVMAVDEALALHEEIEHAEGIAVDWQLLASPLIVLAAALWLLALPAVRGVPLAGPLWLLGAACWAIAQVLEAVPWELQVGGADLLSGGEELLEMSGSAFLLLALVRLCALDRATRYRRRELEAST